MPLARCLRSRGFPSTSHALTRHAPQARVNATAVAEASEALAGPASGQELLTYLNAPLTRYLPLKRRGHKKSLIGAKQDGGAQQALGNASSSAAADAGTGSCAAGGDDGSCAADAAAAGDGDGEAANPSADDEPPSAPPPPSAADSAALAREAALEAEAEEEEIRLAKAKTPVPHLRGRIKLITVTPQPVFRKCVSRPRLLPACDGQLRAPCRRRG